jgi:hypothetical protein
MHSPEFYQRLLRRPLESRLTFLVVNPGLAVLSKEVCSIAGVTPLEEQAEVMDSGVATGDLCL